MNFYRLLWLASLLVPIFGAVIGIRAASIVVRDNLDEFISDIRRQSLWATWAAIASSIAAILSAIVNWHVN
jgi:hypothetical protein